MWWCSPETTQRRRFALYFFHLGAHRVTNLSLKMDAQGRSSSCTAHGFHNLHIYMSKGVRVAFSGRERAWWLSAFKLREVSLLF